MVKWETYQERDQDIISNAEYWTLIRRQNLRYERQEFPTREAAVDAAKRAIRRDPEKRFLIYAVRGVNDCFVTAVHKDNI